jgi:L-ascorbate metabolism protein UlaG (beta-lactamase superfamily)
MVDDTLHLWWLGQSGFLMGWRGHFLLMDPYLSDSLTRKYAATDKPHVRMSERVIDPSRLGFVSVVTSSHNHTDHLDAETILPMRAANPGLEILVPSANRDFAAQRLGMEPGQLRSMDAGERMRLGVFEFEAVPAAHEELAKDALGRHLYLGYVVRVGPWTVYHSGDTLRYEGMEEILAPMKIDIALLPINGRAPERRVAGNLDGNEAAGLAKAVGARVVIPCHYNLFEFNTADPAVFCSACERVGMRYLVLGVGGYASSGTLLLFPN